VSPAYAARQQSNGAGPVLYSDEDDLVVTEETGPVLYSDEDDLVVTEETGPVLYSDEEPEITEEISAEEEYNRRMAKQLSKQGGAFCIDDDDNVPHRHAAAPGVSIDLTLDDDDDDAPLERRPRGLFDSTSDDEPIVPPKRPAKRGPKGSRGPAKRGSKKK
jgi:hypothetical protein